MTERRFVKDGGNIKSMRITEGYVRKGGNNPPVSQIQTRPPAPAPMRPANPQRGGNTGSQEGNSRQSGKGS